MLDCSPIDDGRHLVPPSRPVITLSPQFHPRSGSELDGRSVLDAGPIQLAADPIVLVEGQLAADSGDAGALADGSWSAAPAPADRRRSRTHTAGRAGRCEWATRRAHRRGSARSPGSADTIQGMSGNHRPSRSVFAPWPGSKLSEVEYTGTSPAKLNLSWGTSRRAAPGPPSMKTKSTSRCVAGSPLTAWTCRTCLMTSA